jgi:hypothetical protein
MKTLSLLLLALACVSLTSCIDPDTARRYLNIDTCRNLNMNFDLDRSRFAGDWYPLATTHTSANCLRARFTNMEDNSLNTIVYNQMNNMELLNFNLTHYGNNHFTFDWENRRSLASIIDTDYNSYAIIYSCTPRMGRNMYDVIILSRTATLPEETMNLLYGKINQLTGLRRFLLSRHSEEFCRADAYIPEFLPTPAPEPTI